jgi:2-keto-4-pentenoate hydratase/2-oxohepta-3-ene-1,7-dioic acid hydratase in catechol pathway
MGGKPMRLCRFIWKQNVTVGLFADDHVVPLPLAYAAFERSTGRKLAAPSTDDLLQLLPPDGAASADLARLNAWLTSHPDDPGRDTRVALADVKLLIPIPRPNKLFLLAGNYAAHIVEGGGKAAERSETFPYVFMKPPSTTLTNPGDPVLIPSVSPDFIDWELELGVVMGRKAKHVREADALQYVAGYTVINDISNRKFRPNPQRKERERDTFFDWLHGKWHDSFCPCGPCITTADEIPDPQILDMELRVNGQVKQKATTAQQIFPVAAVIEFISQFVTLEPGDIIATGTPAGVGHASGTYLKAGDNVEAQIASIGTLVSPVLDESA